MGTDKQHPKVTGNDEEAVDTSNYDADRVQEVTNNERRIRQAVIMIHGIGEQRPMDTLRGFVDEVLVNDPVNGCKYRSKPDAMNELFETRCLQAPSNHKSYRPLTDFYEYYWAHHMEGAKYTQVISWVLGLMFRSPMQIPTALRPTYYVSWGLMLATAILWIKGFLAAGTGSAAFLDGMWQHKWSFVSGLLTLIVQWIGSHFILGYVADAARYLTPNPDNIEARNKIRSEGINLLRTLHNCGKYNRIVVVGHSLGSVIGYDIIRNLWVDLRKPTVPHPQKQTELKAFNQESEKLILEETTPAKIEAFQQCQHRLWQEVRRVGIPWLVTDFVTLGSPLAHAQLLMADDLDDFTRKKAQYEYPCCPPCGGEEPYYGQSYRIDNKDIRNIFIPHHGAPFCCTRWTNLYIPYRALILGDLIGGPLNGVFGMGIRDLAVVPSSDKWLDRTLISHVRYWSGSGNSSSAMADGGDKPSLETLRKILRLDFLRGKSATVKPGVAENNI